MALGLQGLFVFDRPGGLMLEIKLDFKGYSGLAPV